MDSRLPACLLLLALAAPAETLVNGRRSIVLENDDARVVVDLLGGSIVEFRHKALDLNPLVWRDDGPVEEARSMGHFLCLDRWGQPSEAEKANGMPGHGEATKVAWEVVQEPAANGEWIEAGMRASLPMAGLLVERRLRLARNAAWLEVEETVTNQNKLSRAYNIVQHPTLGPPFLDESVLVDSNAAQGFPQGVPLDAIEASAAAWPLARHGERTVNLRFLSDDHDPNVVSYVVEDETGWVTAVNPRRRLLVGYLWKTAEYPWLNIWRNVVEGKPLARGLEFGSTGLHQPFPVLAEKPHVFGRPTFDYLDAGESHTRTYQAFLVEVPESYQGVAQIENGELIERGAGRRLKLR